MRCYKLMVNGKTLFRLDKRNTIAPRLLFEIRTHADSNGTAVLEVYNVDFKNFVGNKALLGKELELHAWIDQTPMTRIVGYRKEYNTLIYRGIILNIVPNYNFGVSTCLTFLMGPVEPKQEKQKAVFLNFEKNVPIINEVVSAIQKLYPRMIVSSSVKKALTLRRFMVKTNLKTEVSSLSDIQKVLRQITLKDGEFMKFFYDGGKSVIISTNLSTEVDIPITDYTINAYDLLAQPQFIDVKIIQLSLRICGKYKLNDIFFIPKTIAYNISPISNKIFEREKLEHKVFFFGWFQITKIWHIGDTHNIEAQQWATNIEASQITL